MIQEESDEAWVDLFQTGNPYKIDYTNNFNFMNESKCILWASEKDGWRHLYQVSLEGKPEVLITKGDYDVIDLKYINQKEGYVYYLASPANATQKYLYRTKLNGKGKSELLSPESLMGSHDYSFSSNGTYAEHTFSNYFPPYSLDNSSRTGPTILQGPHHSAQQSTKTNPEPVSCLYVESVISANAIYNSFYASFY